MPLPGIDWKVRVDQAEAAKFAANPAIVGTALQLVTNGIKATEYRPAGSDKAVDILVRFPEDRRSLDQMDELRVQTPSALRSDQQLRRTCGVAARRLHQPRRRQPRHDGVGERGTGRPERKI